MSHDNRHHVTAWVQMHFSVVLFGFTAIFGRMISLPTAPLVWWRVCIVALLLMMLPTTWKGLRALTGRHWLTYFAIGMVLGLHWLCFYGSVKFANASVAAGTLAISPVMVALVEPLMMRQKIKLVEIALGVLVIPGVLLIAGGTPDRMNFGLLLGVLSAVVVALFTILNKRYIHGTDAITMTCVEMLATWGFIAVVSPLLPTSESAYRWPSQHDALLLVVMAAVFTATPLILELKALRHVSAFGSVLAVNLEPVYTILLSIVLLGEQRELSGRFYLGVLILLCGVFAYPFVHRMKGRIEQVSPSVICE